MGNCGTSCYVGIKSVHFLTSSEVLESDVMLRFKKLIIHLSSLTDERSSITINECF